MNVINVPSNANHNILQSYIWKDIWWQSAIDSN